MKKLLLVFLLITTSWACNKELRAYRIVATDDDPTEEKKAIIADRVARLFPPTVTYIKGETIVTTDTISDLNALAELSFMIDSLKRQKPDLSKQIDSLRVVLEARCIPKIIKDIRIRVDTHFKESGPIISSLQQDRARLSQQLTMSKTEVDEKQKVIDKQKKINLWLWIALGAAVALTVVGVIYKFRKSFSIKNLIKS